MNEFITQSFHSNYQLLRFTSLRSTNKVIARPELHGLRLAIPSATRNFAVDEFVPKPLSFLQRRSDRYASI
ncbi:hypothetical protein Bca4012_040837 [Brassica carinata]|uniref:Uncharacterized protein n=1 Tax=Brassica carinata TaxID=52824 RepID=A0A8X7QZT6_BRACI|nr:hypothetical protein Bca52824_061417 [Brassica carinata]